MYISEILIKNYRSFGNNPFKMDLRKFTTIIGENNVGKTNLLESIGLILSQEITMFKKRMLHLEDINYKTRADFIEQILNKDIYAEEVEFPEVRIDLTFKEMNETQLAIVGDWFSSKEMDQAKLTYSFKPSSKFNQIQWVKEQRQKIDEIKINNIKITKKDLYIYIDFPIKSYHYTIYGGLNSSNIVDPYFLSMLKIETLDALRDAKRELIANGEYKLLYKILNQGHEDSYEDIKEVLSSLEEKLKTNQKLNEIKTTLVSQLDKISLEYSGGNNIDFNFTNVETSEILKKLSLIYGQDPITIDRNGLGRNNLLYISLILSHLSPDEKESTFFRVVGIEEPEAHLHPHLQKHLAANIELINEARDDLQIILTSHSTHITSTLNSKNTVVLYKHEGENKKHYITDGFGDNAKDKTHLHYLEKYLDATNSSMFYARRIILVEGIAEQIIVPALFSLKYGKTLDSFGCNIINVNGVAFKHFLEIIKNGYFIKCGVLTDGDISKKTENRARNLREEYEEYYKTIKISINKDTFEKELIESNKNGSGKDILIRALKSTRPQKGKGLEKEIDEKEIMVNDFFDLIEDYKSEFAFNLTAELKNVKKSDFEIPQYINEIFEFIKESGTN